jgi:hypothetical protein
MLASRFQSLLAEEIGKTDLSQRAPNDMPQRFDSLRGYRLLPTGRTKNVTPLSLAQMATTILAITTVKPGYAGLAGKTLSSRRSNVPKTFIAIGSDICTSELGKRPVRNRPAHYRVDSRLLSMCAALGR